MGYQEINSLDCSITIAIGGRDKKTGKLNPTGIEGYYLGAKEIPDKFKADGKGKLHVFQTEKGNVGVFGKTDLNNKLSKVATGTMTKVEAAGSVPTNKGNDKLLFKVLVDTSNTIEISTADNGEETEEYVAEDLEESEEYISAPPKAAMSAEERRAQVQALLKKR